MTTISTLGQSQLIRTETGKLQDQINELQQQVSSGQKASRYGDLGTLASLDINLRNQGERVTALKTSLSFLKTRTTAVDQTLAGVRQQALDLRNLSISSLSFDAGRQQIISTARNAIADITQKLQANVDGRYVFGGVNTDTPPMVSDTTLMPTVQTAVNAVLTAAPAGLPAAIQAAVSGIFATTSNFYTGGAKHAPTEVDDGRTLDLSIVGNDPALRSTLEGLYTIAALPMPKDDPVTPPDISRTDFDATVTAAVQLIGGGMNGIDDLVSANGRNQAAIDSAEQSHDATLTLIQQQVDGVENVDLADVSARIAQLRTQLQASFSLTAQLKDLSLVNFLK